MRLLTTLLISADLLYACGGGGGGSTPAATSSSSLNFPLRQGMATSVAAGRKITLTAQISDASRILNGDCSGSFTISEGRLISGNSFNGNNSAYAVNTAVTMSLNSCILGSSYAFTSADTYTYYYDINYLQLGSVNLSTNEVGVWRATPNIPVSVHVGDVINVGTETYYTNSTLAVETGYQQSTIVIEPDTVNTAIVNKIVKKYDRWGTLQLTAQGRSRIDASGNLSTVSTDIQQSVSPYLHLVFHR